MKKHEILAEFSEGIEKASISFWYIKEGDTIEKEQPLVEFVTEKTSFTYPSPVSGKITKLFFNEGDEVFANQIIAEVESE